MTLNQILDELPTEHTFSMVDNNIAEQHKTYHLTIKDISKLIESVAEEIIGVVPVKEIAEFQRLKVKEIITILK